MGWVDEILVAVVFPNVEELAGLRLDLSLSWCPEAEGTARTSTCLAADSLDTPKLPANLGNANTVPKASYQSRVQEICNVSKLPFFVFFAIKKILPPYYW